MLIVNNQLNHFNQTGALRRQSADFHSFFQTSWKHMSCFCPTSSAYRGDQMNLFSKSSINKLLHTSVILGDLTSLKFLFDGSCCSHDVMWSNVITECVSSDPTVFIIRLVVLPVTLLLVVTVVYFILKVLNTCLLFRRLVEMKQSACLYWTEERSDAVT